jgi:hypothetical protein
MPTQKAHLSVNVAAARLRVFRYRHHLGSKLSARDLVDTLPNNGIPPSAKHCTEVVQLQERLVVAPASLGFNKGRLWSCDKVMGTGGSALETRRRRDGRLGAVNIGVAETCTWQMLP